MNKSLTWTRYKMYRMLKLLIKYRVFTSQIVFASLPSKKSGSNMSGSAGSEAPEEPSNVTVPSALVARKLWLLVGMMKYAKEIDELDSLLLLCIFFYFYAFFSKGEFALFDLSGGYSNQEQKEYEDILQETFPNLRVT